MPPHRPTAPRRPLRLTHHIGPTMSGSTHVVLKLVRLHDRRLFEPSLVISASGSTDPRLIAEADRLGVPWREAPKHGRYDLTVIGRVAAAFRSLRTEVAVLHGFGGYTFGAGGAVLARVPARVRFEHSPELYTTSYRVMARAAEPLSHSTILVSRYLADYLAGLGLHPPAPEVIYNGVELDSLLAVSRPPLSDEGQLPVVLMAARLEPPKEQAVLVEAVALLKARGVGVRLRLAGIGPEEPRLRAQAASLGVGDRVELLGYRSDLPALMEQADIVALCTRFEGFGLAAVEGMAAARPVVVSRVASLPELVEDGCDGLLVEPGSAEAAAQAIARLVGDRERARAMGLAGRARAEQQFALLPSVRAIEAHLLRTAFARGLR